MRDGPDGQLLGQPEVDAGELRRDQALAEVADGRQHLVGRLPEQLGQPVDQGQPAGGLLEIGVRLGDDGIVHPAIIAQARSDVGGQSAAVARAACTRSRAWVPAGRLGSGQ